jgi:hypothetical protein
VATNDIIQVRHGTDLIVGAYHGTDPVVLALAGTSGAVSGGTTGGISGVYIGAQIKGAYELTNRGAASGDDAPYSGDPTKPKPTAWDTFEGGVNGAPASIGSMGGKRLSYVQFGLGLRWPQTNMSAYTTLADWCYARGSFPQYDWSPPDQTAINDILAGNATAKANLTTVFDVLLSHGKPVLFRPMHEMNGSWYVWGVPGGGGASTLTDAQYKTLWQRLWQYCADRAAGVPAGTGTGTNTKNVSFFWCPNAWSNAAGSVPAGSNRYPGDAYVDWVGFDIYARANTGATPQSLFGFTTTALEQLTSKPIAVGEWGVMDSVGGAGKAAFFTNLFGQGGFLDQHPRIKALNYFHRDGNDGPDVFIPTVEANRVAYANGVGRDKYLANVAGPFPADAKLPIPS